MTCDDAMWVPVGAGGAVLHHEAAQGAVQFHSAVGSGRVLMARRVSDNGTAAGGAGAAVAAHLSAVTGPAVQLSAVSGDVADGELSETPVFTVQFGPTQLPSEHLAELRATGLTRLRVCSTRATAAMRATVQRRMDTLTASREAAGADVSGEGRVQEFSLSDPEDEEQFSMCEYRRLISPI